MLKVISKREKISEECLKQKISEGKICVVKNNQRDIYPLVIGEGLFTKVNANIGTSKQVDDQDEELRKLDMAVSVGADAVMDLSTGNDIDDMRKKVLERSRVAVGTVPVYQVMVEAMQEDRKIHQITKEDFLGTVRKHAEQGVDFATIHTGIDKATLQELDRNRRTIPVVSRGGSFIVEWMRKTGQENPYFEHFDVLMDISKKYNMSLSLGDGMRPGCIRDATDSVQMRELINLCDQARRCVDDNITVFIEGPGHIPLDEIRYNVEMQKRLSGGVPFYVLGPLVVDIAPGYDHITGAIGGALAASCGVDFLCYVTPAEHLRLPTIADVRQGVIASRIAAHAADIVKREKIASNRDLQLSKMRRDFDWEGQKKLVVDPVIFTKYLENPESKKGKPCTLCGDFCAMKDKF